MLHQEGVFGWFSVLSIKVPLATLRLITIHEKSGFATHISVEVFHPQFLAALCPAAELRVRAYETLILQNLKLNAIFVCPGRHGFRQPVFGRFCHDRRSFAKLMQRAFKLAI